MAEYTKIKTARTIICELCNELYPDDPCKPACDWLQMLEEDAVSVPQWISVKDRLPENNERVFAFCIDLCVHDVVWSWSDDCWYNIADGLTYNEGLATHWMPLPELPKGENDG